MDFIITESYTTDIGYSLHSPASLFCLFMRSFFSSCQKPRLGSFKTQYVGFRWSFPCTTAECPKTGYRLLKNKTEIMFTGQRLNRYLLKNINLGYCKQTQWQTQQVVKCQIDVFYSETFFSPCSSFLCSGSGGKWKSAGGAAAVPAAGDGASQSVCPRPHACLLQCYHSHAAEQHKVRLTTWKILFSVLVNNTCENIDWCLITTISRLHVHRHLHKRPQEQENICDTALTSSAGTAKGGKTTLRQ